MSTVNEPCAICRKENLETIIELPHYPLTDTLCHVMPEVIPSNYDQALIHCADCGHIQLATFLQSDLLYGSHYHFRTGESAMARSGTAFFLEFLDHLAPRHNYRLIVDIGCNDLHCLASLEGRATKRIGVDPIWKNRSVPPDDGILVVGKAVEDTNWDFLEGEKADLIICRHTLEHLRDPRSAIEQFLDRLSDDGVLIVEVPGVEALIDKFRFDQIFHQHLHYFSAPILRRLIHTSGGRVVNETENWFNWGARLIAAQKGRGTASDAGRDATPCSKDIARRYSVFQRQMSTTIDLLQLLSEETTIVGYGAGQMLPVLSWHLGSDLGLLGCVLDDDRTKDGLHYANLPLTVRHPNGPADWENQAVMITAVDHAHSIVHKLHAFPPRHVVHPLCFL